MLAQLTSPFAVGVAARLSSQLVAFATVVVAARHLGLAEFGVYALAWAVAVIATTFLYSGPYQAMLRSPGFEEERDTFFWLMLAIGAAGGAVLGLTGAVTGGGAGAVFVALAPVPLVQAPVAWLEAQLVHAGRTRAAASYVVAAELTALVGTAAALVAGWGTLALAAGRLAAVLVALVLVLAMVRRRPRLAFRRRALAQIRTTILPLWSTTGLAMFSNYGADLVLGAFLSPLAVGSYRSGARISMTVADLILQPLVMLSWARMTRLEREGRSAEIGAAWLAHMGIGAALFWPVACGLALLSEPLVRTVFGPAWVAAAPVVALLAMARSLRFLSALLEPALTCAGQARLLLRIRLVAATLLLALLLAFGRLGAEPAALAQMLAGLAVALMSLPALARVLRLGGRALLGCFAPGLALAALVAAAVPATAPLRDQLSAPAGLAATIGLLAVIWLGGIALGLRSGRLALPAP